MQMVRRFKADQRGATAMLFGFTALPLLGLVGAAVDYSRASAYHSRMQRAADAAVLAIVREPSNSQSCDIQQRGEQIFRAMLGDTSAVESSCAPQRTTQPSSGTPASINQPASIQAVVAKRDGRDITLTASASMDRTIMKVMGLQPMPISVTAKASSARRLEVALVLDNTFSMSELLDDGTVKMAALKTQATKVLDSLQTLAAQPGRGRDSVKVSIVPFDTEVRLDPAKFRNENWFHWRGEGANSSNWTGYVYDRPGDYASRDDAPTGAKDSFFPAPRYSECASEGAMKCPSSADLPAIQPLASITDSRNRLNDVIASMQPRGYTNIGIGAVWGQATLSSSRPFTEGADAGDDSVQKVMLVLTDGLNTAHHVGGQIEKSTAFPENSIEAKAVVGRIDTKTRAACENAKASGTEIFTIRVLEGDEDMLRSCASSPANYSNVKTQGDMGAAFDKFLEKITQTRITH